MKQKFRKFTTLVTPSKESYYASSILVLLACLCITIWAWNTAKNNLEQDIQTSLVSATRAAEQAVNASVYRYSEVAKGGASFFGATPQVDSTSWKNYISNLDFASQHPGLQSIAYSQVVPGNAMPDFLATNINKYTGQPLLVKPSGARATYVITQFIEPYRSVALGYDPYSEPIRRKAMDQSRDSNQPAITERITLVQDRKTQPGFIIFVPVYNPGQPIDTIQQRRAAIKGFVSAGVRSTELIEGLFAESLSPDSALQIYDGATKKPASRIYQSPSYDNLIKQSKITQATRTFKSGNKDWTISTYVNQNFASKTQREQPQEILLGGIIFSLLFPAFLFILMFNRARAITNEKNREVIDVKDNLISLASHQLRTPATGVKQFIGMVLEGYAGPIKPEQKVMLEKAYLSNERQLEIINQILHVTRVESDRLVMRKEKINITELTRAIINDYEQTTLTRKQEVTFESSAQSILLSADKQYITIVIDNLINNASKYSHKNTTIAVQIRRTKELVIIKVSDQGVGIEESEMHLLFQKFSRIHNNLSVEAGGNGIGLYLCRQIILLHGGTIEARSTKGKGTSFTVTLPRKG